MQLEENEFSLFQYPYCLMQLNVQERVVMFS